MCCINQELELPLAGNEAGVEGVDAVVDCADIMNRFLANHIKDPIAAGENQLKFIVLLSSLQ